MIKDKPSIHKLLLSKTELASRKCTDRKSNAQVFFSIFCFRFTETAVIHLALSSGSTPHAMYSLVQPGNILKL